MINEMCTYILKVKVGDNYYIVNRNDTWMDSLITEPKHVKWFGLDKKKFKSWVLHDFEVLETLPLDNKNHCHQKIINKIKQDYRETLGGEVVDTPMVDEAMMDVVKDKRKRIKDAYDKLFDKHFVMEHNLDSYEKMNILIDLINGDYYRRFKGSPRVEIYRHRDEFPSEEHFVFFMFHASTVDEWKRYCFGWWMNNPGKWDSYEDCVSFIVTSKSTWEGLDVYKNKLRF